MKLSFKKPLCKTLAAAAICAGTLSATTPALAGETVDWSKVITEADNLLRTGSTKTPLKLESKLEAKRAAQAAAATQPNVENMGNAWFGVAPKVTVVARDWQSSTRLAGDKMGFTENLRLAASTRMVVGRVRLSNTRFTPFMQVGFGQWRADRRYAPTLDNDIEVAGQLGSGFELRLTRAIQLAAELSATTLIRYDVNDQQPHNVLWSALVASRVQF